MIAAAIELALYRIPSSRRWMRELAPYSFASTPSACGGNACVTFEA
jgi:hypothetical protein